MDSGAIGMNEGPGSPCAAAGRDEDEVGVSEQESLDVAPLLE